MDRPATPDEAMAARLGRLQRSWAAARNAHADDAAEKDRRAIDEALDEWHSRPGLEPRGESRPVLEP